jgi:hypothetical protein
MQIPESMKFLNALVLETLKRSAESLEFHPNSTVSNEPFIINNLLHHQFAIAGGHFFMVARLQHS